MKNSNDKIPEMLLDFNAPYNIKAPVKMKTWIMVGSQTAKMRKMKSG
jgi:hypothetical protein